MLTFARRQPKPWSRSRRRRNRHRGPHAALAWTAAWAVMVAVKLETETNTTNSTCRQPPQYGFLFSIPGRAYIRLAGVDTNREGTRSCFAFGYAG